MALRVRHWASSFGPVARVELHLTPDIVALPPQGRNGDVRLFALVTSANERLQAPQFTTSEAAAAFPGTNIIYPEQIVDGRVHELGGKQLAATLSAFPALDDRGTRCATGSAVITRLRPHNASPLEQSFEHIVHTVAPSFDSPNWEPLLTSCYCSALNLAWDTAATLPASNDSRCDEMRSVAIVLPLLGAGAKAAPVAAAARVAAESCASWKPAQPSPAATISAEHTVGTSRSRPCGAQSKIRLQLLFGVQEDTVAGEVEEQFDRQPQWT